VTGNLRLSVCPYVVLRADTGFCAVSKTDLLAFVCSTNDNDDRDERDKYLVIVHVVGRLFLTARDWVRAGMSVWGIEDRD
jgi:hypothetical protein